MVRDVEQRRNSRGTMTCQSTAFTGLPFSVNSHVKTRVTLETFYETVLEYHLLCSDMQNELLVGFGNDRTTHLRRSIVASGLLKEVFQTETEEGMIQR